MIRRLSPEVDSGAASGAAPAAAPEVAAPASPLPPDPLAGVSPEARKALYDSAATQARAEYEAAQKELDEYRAREAELTTREEQARRLDATLERQANLSGEANARALQRAGIFEPRQPAEEGAEQQGPDPLEREVLTLRARMDRSEKLLAAAAQRIVDGERTGIVDRVLADPHYGSVTRTRLEEKTELFHLKTGSLPTAEQVRGMAAAIRTEQLAERKADFERHARLAGETVGMPGAGSAASRPARKPPDKMDEDELMDARLEELYGPEQAGRA